MYWQFEARSLITAKGPAMGSASPSAGVQGARSDTINPLLLSPPPPMFGGRRQNFPATIEGRQVPDPQAPHSQTRFHSCNQLVAADSRHSFGKLELIRRNQERRGE